MTKKQNGVVLLTTILMIAILSLLVLSLMKNVFIYIKEYNQMAGQHYAFYQMETIANNVDVTKIACVIHTQDPNQAIKLLLLGHSCALSDETRQYKYILADLGVAPCLQINIGQNIYSSHHWLLTLTTIAPPSMILQLRIATIAKPTKCELHATKMIQAGVLSWRKESKKDWLI